MKMENEALCNFGAPFEDVVSVRIFFPPKLAIRNCKMLFFSCLIFEGLHMHTYVHTYILHELLILG